MCIQTNNSYRKLHKMNHNFHGYSIWNSRFVYFDATTDTKIYVPTICFGVVCYKNYVWQITCFQFQISNWKLSWSYIDLLISNNAVLQNRKHYYVWPKCKGKYDPKIRNQETKIFSIVLTVVVVHWILLIGVFSRQNKV